MDANALDYKTIIVRIMKYNSCDFIFFIFLFLMQDLSSDVAIDSSTVVKNFTRLSK